MFTPAALLALTIPAHAGERVFAHSYGYGTVPKGGVEVEHYLTAYGKEGGERFWWEHQVELEYGITDRLELGAYLVAAQWDDSPLSFRGYKARLRYRLGSQGVGPVDANLYLEYIGNTTFDAQGVEAKVILARSVGERFTSALNVEYEAMFEEAGITHEIEPTVAAGWYVTPAFVVGAEGRFETYFTPTGVDGPFAWAGPTVHLSGEGGKLWWTLSMLLPVSGHTAEDQGVIARSLVAVNL